MSEKDEKEPSRKRAKLAAAGGGTFGAVLGSRRGRLGTLVGGLLGGTLGYLAGSAIGKDAESVPIAEEPVSIDVATPADEDES